MDVIGNMPDGKCELIDVAIVSPVRADRAEQLAKSAKKRGHMAAEAEKVKIRRYPNVNELVTFAIETGGRMANRVRHCVRRCAPEPWKKGRW